MKNNKPFNNRSKFIPSNVYSYYFMNKYTPLNLLHYLIGLAQTTSSFTISTLFDAYTDTPALIVVEIIQATESVLVVVETCHLPYNRKSLQFWLIQSFIKIIFKPEKTVFTWDDARYQLASFVQYGLFTDDLLAQVYFVDVRREYLRFHSSLFKRNRNEIQYLSLEQIILNVFNECLGQQKNEYIWSQGFYQPSRHILNHPALQSMVRYALNSCLAITKLLNFIRY